MQVAATLAAIESSPNCPLLPAGTEPIGSEPAILHRAVLRWVDACKLSDRSSLKNLPRLSDAALQAMHRLVSVIAQLRSPDSGWPADSPQTPEAIAPYVIEEAEDVAHQLMHPREDASSVDLPSTFTTAKLAQTPTDHSFFQLSDLEPWALWCIARSGYDTMRLLEGIPASVMRPTQTWSSGILRLVGVVEIHLGGIHSHIDLATQQVSPLLLPTDAQIQAEDNERCRQPVEVGHLLQSLTVQIRTTTPAIGSLLNGVGIEALIPDQNWHSGNLQLQLGFEFVEHAVDHSAHRLIAPEVVVSGLGSPAAMAQPASATPLITFIDADWTAQYELAIARQQLAEILRDSVPFQTPPQEWQLSESELLSVLVEDACKSVEAWQASVTLSNRNFPQHEVGLDELILRLLWCFSRSSYTILQLLGGVKVKLLQPHHAWQNGCLRLSVRLKVRTPEVDWHLDLTTGQSPDPAEQMPLMDTVVWSADSSLVSQPICLKTLKDEVWQEIAETTPEVQLLMDGTGVDLLDAEHEWQAGVLQLTADFAFLPD